MGLDTVELVMTVEEKFDISITDKDASEIATVGELYNTVLAKLAGKGGSVDKEKVWELLRAIFVDFSGIKPEKIVPEARIVDDLGLD